MCGPKFRRFHRRHSNTNNNRWAAATRRRHFFEFLEQRRLLSGGVPDPSFGSGGKVVTDFPGTAFDAVGGSAIQSDGRIVVLSAGNDANSARLVRFTANGQLDATFGSGGSLFLSHRPGALALRGDDKIVIATQADANNVLLARYTANGQVDTTFGGGDGQVVQPIFGGAQTGPKFIMKILVRPDNGTRVRAGRRRSVQQRFAPVRNIGLQRIGRSLRRVR
jgi:uncharacterized delta-60 repeat protein